MRDEYDFSAGKGGSVLKRPPKDGERIVDLPIVCTLKPATIATRKAALLPGLVGRADRREETTAGIRLRLPADVLSAIFETVDAERQCCRFLRFDITVEPDGGPIWLELVGPPGTKEFLSALLELSADAGVRDIILAPAIGHTSIAAYVSECCAYRKP